MTAAVRAVRRPYAWVVFGVTFVTLLLASARIPVPGVVLDPLHEELGWSKGTVGAAQAVSLVLFGLMGPLAAALLARFGLRRVVTLALVTVTIGTGLTSVMTQPWHFVLAWGVIVGAGTGCMATVLAASVANRWFVARRGLITGCLTAATATGQLVFLPVLTALSDGPGWRWVVRVAALSAALAIVPVVLLMRDKPEDVGQRALGAPEGYRTPPPPTRPISLAWTGLRSVSGSRAFWLLVGGFFVCGLSTNGLVQTHFISAAHDHGLARTTAAGYLVLIGVFDIIGTMASGALTDRYDPRRLLFAYYALRGVSLLVLEPSLTAGSAPLVVFMVFYGLDWVATVPPTVALCRECFGPELATVTYGWVFAAHQLGGASAAWGAGALRDLTGSYTVAWLLAGVCCLGAAIGSLSIGRPALRPVPIT